ncbi:MAG: TylF/MycF/NovP-related O-methyltransferase [Thermodesulfobacteriota bacterium]|jgi:asparagine synthase (glutamine-hydrolysing)
MKQDQHCCLELINIIRKHNLTYLDDAALIELAEAVWSVEGKNICGIFTEVGCALGGSAIVICTAKSIERQFDIYDIFEMIPPPSEKDGEDVHARYETITEGKSPGINGDLYYGYEPDLYKKVIDNFSLFNVNLADNNVRLIKGLFTETLRINSPVAFAHIDCDWYESVMTCLERIEPFLTPGGIFVIDDYYTWSGCTKAVDEYFSDKRNKFEFVNKSRLHIKKC